MSLRWQIPQVPALESGLFQAIIFATMVVDLGTITEKNADEFYRRVNLWQRHVEPFARQFTGERPEPYYFTREDIRQCIGLRTNVLDRTGARWAKRLLEAIEETTPAMKH
jgi:hypothetical protein